MRSCAISYVDLRQMRTGADDGWEGSVMQPLQTDIHGTTAAFKEILTPLLPS